ncbi:MAG: hypothetical protein HWE14_01135 [Flavobacteriia bacterium]|nr:hypothetical protein [Flavobacteriia bacterium]
MRFYTVLFAFVFGLSSLAQEKVTLRLTPHVGDEFVVSIDQRQVINQTVMGMEQIINQDQTLRMVYECTGNADGVIEMDATIDGVKMETSGITGEMSYDSDNPEAEPEGEALVYSAMIGSVLKAQFDKYGALNELTGIDAIIDKVAAAFGFVEGSDYEMFKEEMANTISDETFKKDFGAAMLQFPKEELGVGDTWTQTSSFTAKILFNVETTYTVEEITKDSIILMAEGVLSTTSENSDPISVNGMELLYDLNGTQGGTIQVDRKTGWVTNSKIIQEVSGEIEMLPNDQLPDGMTWPMSITTVMTMTTE